jgi:hypothetical protein
VPDAIDAVLAGLDDALERALDEAAERAANVARKRAPGDLARAVRVRRVGALEREIIVDAPGAAAVEQGRGPVDARSGGVLRFTVNGATVFARHVGAAKAHPFMAPAGDQLEQDAAELVACALGRLAG